MPSLHRGLRRALAIVAVVAPLLAVGAMPAEARTCTWWVYIGPTPVTDVTTPCPGPQDQPVGAPVWLTTPDGPGFYSPEWDFIKVTQGSHVFFANYMDGISERVHGNGFDTGVVPSGGVAEVAGVPSLRVGEYDILDIHNVVQGLLIIEKSPVPPITG